MRGGSVERKIDRKEAEAEFDIETAYDEALSKAFRDNQETLNHIKAIMNGEERPPRRCVTEKQKARWKEKTLLKLLESSGILSMMATEIVLAGKFSVARIQQFGLDAYKTAYSGTMKRLKE